MNFEKEQIVTLNNKKEHFVINKIIYNNYLYAFLVNINEEDDYFIVKQKKNLKLIRVSDNKVAELLKEYL